MTADATRSGGQLPQNHSSTRKYLGRDYVRPGLQNLPIGTLPIGRVGQHRFSPYRSSPHDAARRSLATLTIRILLTAAGSAQLTPLLTSQSPEEQG